MIFEKIIADTSIMRFRFIKCAPDWRIDNDVVRDAAAVTSTDERRFQSTPDGRRSENAN